VSTALKLVRQISDFGVRINFECNPYRKFPVVEIIGQHPVALLQSN
jgi:hypothetical protein